MSVDALRAHVLSHYPRTPDYVELTRLNRPIGIYLLLWPTLWALWIAAEGFPGWHLFLVFTIGTVLTRSAGCIVNDIADRKFDGQVKRTSNRPLVTGHLNVPDALTLMAVLLFCALLLVLSTNLKTVALAAMAAMIAGIYPFMKRYIYLPQVVLGIAFSCGIPMAFTAMSLPVSEVVGLLMAANLIWTVAYDTEYAMVDRDDDLRLGLKSSAILFAEMDKTVIAVLQALFLVTLFFVAHQASLGWPFYLGCACAAGLLIYQQFLIIDRKRDACFAAFRNNHWVGLSIFLGIVGHYAIS